MNSEPILGYRILAYLIFIGIIATLCAMFFPGLLVPRPLSAFFQTAHALLCIKYIYKGIEPCPK